jgi:hypothetical protein
MVYRFCRPNHAQKCVCHICEWGVTNSSVFCVVHQVYARTL